ncbi:uncharacterized protein LOC133827081 [Humulus lupulus]|uniref:uncharacterized protein LOC133827081 n=1 Tax=Humulus lupulus TaxID=3486 RepID=UPI002B40E1C4|nr:uncharacterized protein LOC133827081 [Humulus lupulus]
MVQTRNRPSIPVPQASAPTIPLPSASLPTETSNTFHPAAPTSTSPPLDSIFHAPHESADGIHVPTSNHYSTLTSPNLHHHEDVHNPYFLGNGDHLGLILASPTLTEKKIPSWRRDFQLSIGAKNKNSFLNGDLQPPATTIPNYNSWQGSNQMVMSWLLHSVSPEIKTSILYLETALAMWTELNNIFDQGNRPRIFELCNTLISLHQGDDM